MTEVLPIDEDFLSVPRSMPEKKKEKEE